VSLILVVDPEPAIRSLIAVALHPEGLAVPTAANGVEAAAISRSHPGQIVLLIADALMPEMERGNLASELLFDHPEMGILLMSSRHMPASKGHFAYADFLAKPFPIEMLLAKVRGLLRNIRSRPAA
jgi:DNA-binding response OmpR family regulator